MASGRKAFRILGGLLLIGGLLVGTHQGEFWPLSIHPMFSEAGRPWTRALVRTVPSLPDSLLWRTTDLDTLPGEPLPLVPHGLWQNDLANYISKTKTWDPDRIEGLRIMFSASGLQRRSLLIMKVQGCLTSTRRVVVVAVPFVLLTGDTARFHPNLPANALPAPCHPVS